ncbi:hypothetical protein [Rhizobium terrae]|uniref:hypothetical protein n=1 Tax=Rhizobium terrae TaxID=2171756 RepID=UPI0013C32FDA|nr:hypothetical protein [Rhizobium terrae]
MFSHPHTSTILPIARRQDIVSNGRNSSSPDQDTVERDDASPDLATLTCHHQSLLLALLRHNIIDQGNPHLAELVRAERLVRQQLVLWQPRDEPEARLKLAYFASYVLATRTGFDAEAMQIIRGSVERFF